ncbi:MAG: hypothetical protein JWP91_2928 [Fibrobacteres bacterium]|nr:hypothetical protein [Fibrobacterota bacterium]
MISVFDYLDYRQFLRDFYNQQKKTNTFFSYRYIGNKVGMDSSFLIKVLQGHLHVAEDRIEKFHKICNFNDKEAQYFEALVHFNKAKSEKESKLYFEKMLSINKAKSDKIVESQYEFFQKWYYSAVWALLDGAPFKGDIKDLGNMLTPAIGLKEAKAAIKLLEDLKLIVQDADGAYRAVGLNLTTGKEWRSVAIMQYQREMIKLAEESLERFRKEERDISTLTVNIPESAIPEIRDLTGEFRESLKKLVNSYTETDRVYQMNIQMFPLTQKRKAHK